MLGFDKMTNVCYTTNMKLKKSEEKESMFITWGRILTISRGMGTSDPERLELLAEKFNKDMAQALIEEKHFK